jgi:hypothetical protein
MLMFRACQGNEADFEAQGNKGIGGLFLLRLVKIYMNEGFPAFRNCVRQRREMKAAWPYDYVPMTDGN